MAKLRCAIYTRKSSEEGLEQDFNSLHAQREACEAYIKSQVGEGWVALKTNYDDGGFSGGKMDRPGLRALLADVDRRLVDIVVVYKVDRLTRSITDFGRIVEAFDRSGVSFVSVTQAFNTTTSMGRLTLNVLLSFAQFEREVTGERIRDKIAASKAKGMWMGGNLPLGYDAKDRRLEVNPGEAQLVRRLFDRYLELGSVHALKAELDREGILSKISISSKGVRRGGQPFSRGALFHLLKNPVYIGQIRHRDMVHPGLHPPIVEVEVFEAVQRGLGDNRRARQERPSKRAAALLKGKIFDQEGRPMTPTFSHGKSGRSFRYYVSLPLQKGEKPRTADGMIRRVSAPPLEALVLDRIGRLFADPAAGLSASLSRVDVRSNDLRLSLSADPNPHAGSWELDRLAVKMECRDQLELESATGMLHITIPARPVFRGGRTWLVAPDGRGAVTQPRIDPTMVKALRNAHEVLSRHSAAPYASVDELRAARSPSDSHVRRMMAIAFLAPDIQMAILEGRQPAGLTTERILRTDLPLDWEEQHQALGF